MGLPDEVVLRVWRSDEHPDPVTDDGRRVDYVDTFVVELRADDPHAATAWLRAGLVEAGLPVRTVVSIAWRAALGLRLGPWDAPGHLAGWRVVVAETGAARLEADGRLVRAVLVARDDGHRTGTMSTYLTWRHPVARHVWSVVGVAHRFLVPRLMVAAAHRLSTVQPK